MAAIQEIWGSRAFRVGIAQSALWAALGVALSAAARSFKPIYADFGVALPTLTQRALDVGVLLSKYWYLCFLPLCVWPFVFWGVASLLSGRPGDTPPNRLWSWATWLVLLLIVAFVVFAIFCPLIVLINRLSA